MVQDVNLTSDAWCDIIFEGKNKKYGAFYLRKTSSKRHLKALLIVIFLCIGMVVLPMFLKFVLPEKAQDDTIDIAAQLSNLEQLQETKPENQIKQETVPEPPKLKETVKFTPPVIAKDVKEEDEMKTVDELKDTKAQISVADVKGSTDADAVDIADLKENKVVVAEVEKPFQVAEVMPSFPGGDKELMSYLSKNLKYPVIAAEQGIQGRVVLRFVVGKDGEISNIEVVRSLESSCDKEAIRVVKSMPRWIPGKQNGKSVPVYFSLPVRFQLQ